MLSIHMIWISLIGVILSGVCFIAANFKKDFQFEIIALVFLFLALISGLGALVEKEVALNTSSENYYYDMLEKKTFIEEKLETNKEEIEALRTGNVNGIAFKNKNEIMNINNAIKQYNTIILRNQEYKNSYWHSERYNEAVAKLNVFEEIF